MSITKVDRKTGERHVRRTYSSKWLAARAARKARREAAARAR